MATGPIDHPSFLTRQRQGVGIFTAGAAAVGNKVGMQFAIRPHVPTVVVQTAGTTAVNAMKIAYVGTYTLTQSGTTTTTSGTNVLGTTTIGTATANSVINGADMNVTCNAGGVFYLLNNTDATAVYEGSFDYTLDPVLGTWTGV